MKKSLLSVLALFLFFILVQPANAQLKKGSWLWTLSVGYVPVTSQLTNNSLDGWVGSTTVEKLIGKSNWSIGMNFAFFSADDKDAMINGTEIGQSYNTSSLYLGTKYFVSSMGDWVPYFGLGLGVHWTSRYTTISGNTISLSPEVLTGNEHTSNFAFSAPVGLNWFLSKEVFVGLNLTSVWMNDSYYTSDVNLFMNLSVGFQIN
jgi:hypothetical protein